MSKTKDSLMSIETPKKGEECLADMVIDTI